VTIQRAGSWLYRQAEHVAAAMLGVMFLAFVIQIVFRYVFNFPIGWTSELTIVCWLWLVLWGSAFVIKEQEEIRFDLIYGAVGRRVRIAMGIVFALAVVILYAASLPASFSYVAFMKVESSAYLKVRMDLMFSIYMIFLVAVIARYIWILSELVRGRDPIAPDPLKASSGL
jgi:C4-dicarboxylate transporter, DctQ subunit